MTINRSSDGIHCPKCGHVQNNRGECQACGVIFDRYYEMQRRKEAKQVALAEKKQNLKNTFKALAIGLFLPCCLLAAFWAYKPSGDDFVGYLENIVQSNQEEARPPSPAVEDFFENQERQTAPAPADNPVFQENKGQEPRPEQSLGIRYQNPEPYVLDSKPGPRRIESRETEYYKEYCYGRRSSTYRSSRSNSGSYGNEQGTTKGNGTNIRLNLGDRSSGHGFNGKGKLVTLPSQKK